ncbi:MAG: hypothetical protein KGY39_02690 [Anaerolineales bacterium]|nr:hypothetical protein [Anaerolineales bacterium]MBS3753792.1 hypothetical protein [Anaerolineales bacterium]
MENAENWQKQVKRELARAYRAREEGNEGRARVCARRAAGFAADAFFRQRGIDPPAQSPFNLLEKLGSEFALPEPVLETLKRLTLRVDHEFNLPPEVDLIQESKKLIRVLFPEKEISPQSDEQISQE